MKFYYPDNFLWGAASSACQIEGAFETDGKVPNVFDYYSRKYPEKFSFATPDIEADFYHRYKGDIALMKKLGLKSFRFSISWSRIFSDVDSPVNEKGVRYYNDLIDELVKNDIVPFFDLFHCDLPMFVLDRGGLTNPDFVDWFVRYAQVCFSEFGDRVKLWSTVNEPSINVYGAYACASTGPFKSDLKEALLACHHMILAHYKTVRLYHSMNLGGEIGAVIHFEPVYSRTLDPKDVEAAETARDFYSGWWLDPMIKGHYPSGILKYDYISKIMPENYAKEIEENFVPVDFIGINYYNPTYAEAVSNQEMNYRTYIDDSLKKDAYGFAIYPPGLYDAMMYLTDTYGNIDIYITENGTAADATDDFEKDINDDYRILYMREHIRMVGRSLKAGANIKGYYCWSIMDTYEGFAGAYKYIFGLIKVDWDSLVRTPRKSFDYYRNIIKNNSVE